MSKANQGQPKDKPEAAGETASSDTAKAAEEAAFQAELEAEENAKKAKVAGATSVYHVVAGGNLWFKGESRAAFTTLDLTEAEAKELGAAVAPGAYVAPKVENVAARGAGQYRVRKDGGTLALSQNDKRFHSYPDVVTLSGEEARELADVVEPV